MFDLLSKLFEIVAAPVDVEERMRDYHKKVLNTKLVRNTYAGEEKYLKFWLLTNGDLIPINYSHLKSAEDAETDYAELRATGAVAGSIYNRNMTITGRKKLTSGQISKLRDMYIEYGVDAIVVSVGKTYFSALPKSPKEAAYYLEYGKEKWESKNKADLLEQLLNSATATDIRRKHRSIKRLFPDFDAKTKGVEDKGGLRFVDQDAETWKFKIHSGTDSSLWYDAYLHFKNIKSTLEGFVKDRSLWVADKSKVDFRKLSKKFMDKADIQLFCSCFTADTEVRLLDGRIRTMEQLLGEYGTDKRFWIYASNEKGDFVPAKAKCLGVTGRVRNLVEVELDNGEKIKCTPDHLFRMRDGSYKPAVELQPNDSLMPLYLREQKPNSRYSCSYLKVKLNSKVNSRGRSNWKMVHRVVAETILENELESKHKELIETGREKYLVVHHEDTNSFNNVPENLEWLGKDEHWHYHANHDHTNSIRGFKLACQNPEFMQRLVENNRKAGRVCYQKHPELLKKGRQKGIEFMQSEEGRKQAGENFKKVWEDPSIRAMIIQVTQETARSRRDAQSLVMRGTWAEGKLDREVVRNRFANLDQKGEKNSMAKEENRLMIFAGKVMQVCFTVYRKNLPINGFNYENARKERKSIHFEKYFGNITIVEEVFQLALKRTLYGEYRGFWPEDKKVVVSIIRENFYKKEKRCCPNCGTEFEVHPISNQRLCGKYCRGYFAWHRNEKKKSIVNHKVVCIRKISLDKSVPVYDLHVEEYGNYALAAGVYVHNCPAFKFWGPSFILSLDKYDAKYTRKEVRPPKVRNPKRYGMLCKHLDRLMKVLPFYGSTMAKWIADFYEKDITKWEQESQEEFMAGVRKAQVAVAKRREEVPVEEPEVEEPEEEVPEEEKPVTDELEKAKLKREEEKPEEPEEKPEEEPEEEPKEEKPPEEEKPEEEEPEEEPKKKPKKRKPRRAVTPTEEPPGPEWSPEAGKRREEEYF